MKERAPSGPGVRLFHRVVGAAMGVVSRRRLRLGIGPGDDGGRTTLQRLVVPAPGRPDASVLVVTPQRGDPARMPVVYLLHGYPDAPEAPLAAGLARAASGAASSTATLWPPFVLVVPDGTGWGRGDHEWADAADGGDLLESWLIDAVVPAVEEDARRPRSRRTLAGFSMGGFGALNVGLRHPGVFGSLASFSGYALADDPESVFGGDGALLEANSPRTLAEASASGQGEHLRVALVEIDHEQALIEGQAAPMAGALRSAGIDVLELHRPGSHWWRSVASSWPVVLTWLSAGWDPPA